MGGAAGGLLGPACAGMSSAYVKHIHRDEDEASWKNPFPDDLSMPSSSDWMNELRRSTGHGAIIGAEVGGAISGLLTAMPAAILAGLVGDSVGVWRDLVEYVSGGIRPSDADQTPE